MTLIDDRLSHLNNYAESKSMKFVQMIKIQYLYKYYLSLMGNVV